MNRTTQWFRRPLAASARLTRIRLARALLAGAVACAAAGAASAQSLTTLFTGGNGGSPLWTTYFDLTANLPLNIQSMDVNVTATAGTQFTIDVYTTAVGGTWVGNTSNAGVWTLASSSTGTSAGANQHSSVDLTDFILTPGTYGIAIRYTGTSMSYTDGNGSNQVYSNADMTISCGGVQVTTAAPFSSGTLNQPRVWNGTIYYGPGDLTTEGACCFSDGHCTFIIGTDCQTQGGIPRGGGMTCVAANCPQPGACCALDGTCQFVLQSACAGGSWMSGGTCQPTNSCPQPAANDLCENAITVTTATTNIVGNNAVSTPDVDPGTCNTGTQGNFGIWYVFTPATDGTVIFDETSTQDVASGLWAVPGAANPGVDCTTFTSANGLCLSAESWATKFVAGATYYLQVGSSGTTAPTVPFSANLTWLNTPPANDACTSAEDIPAASVWPLAFTADNRFASDDAIDTCSTAVTNAPHSVWYRYTPSTSGTFVINETSTQNIAIAVWDVASAPNPGSDCPAFAGGNTLACTNAETLTVFVTAGHTYYIMLHSELPNPQAPLVPMAGTFNQVAAPVNDTCANAIPVDVTGATYSQTIDARGATPDIDTSCNSTTATSTLYGVWHVLTIPSNENYAVTIGETGTADTVRAVFKGTCGNLTQVFCTDTETGNVVVMEAGQTYYVLTGVFSATAAPTVDYTITMSFAPATSACCNTTNNTCTVLSRSACAAQTPPGIHHGPYSVTCSAATNSANVCQATPANDLCSGAIALSVGAPAYTTPFPAAATDDLDATCNSTTGVTAVSRMGVWYSYTTGTDGGTLRLNESGSNDVFIQQYSGTCGSLTPVACSDPELNVDFQIPANSTRYFLVGLTSNTAVPTTGYSLTAVSFTAVTGGCCTGTSCSPTTASACTGLWLGANASCSGGPQASESPAITIPDAVENVSIGTLTRTLTPSDPGTVSTLAVTVGLTHSFVGDIRVHLQAPNGAQTDLFARPSGTTAAPICPATFATGSGNDLGGTYTFTDAAPTGFNAAALAGSPIPSGSYRAQDCTNTLVDLNTVFLNSPIAGVWTLTVTDEDGASVGTLNSWSLTINGGTLPPCSLAGACCMGASCTLVTGAAACPGIPANFQGGGSTCAATQCAAPAGVCCRGSTCNSSVAQADCTGSGTAGADFVAASAACNSGGVSTTPCCYANYNKVNGVNVQDIFDFLSGWFAGSPLAKVGGSGDPAPLAVQDIFNFLSAWFAGGC